jgi:hypothetical protein
MAASQAVADETRQNIATSLSLLAKAAESLRLRTIAARDDSEGSGGA